jgi:hypothetical protein
MVNAVMTEKKKKAVPAERPVNTKLNPETHRQLKFLADRLGVDSIADALDAVAGDVILGEYLEALDKARQEGEMQQKKKGR